MRALVVHWGRTGGGPRFAVDAVEALSSVGVWTAYSSSSHSERAATDVVVGRARLAVPTFSNAVGFAAGTPRAVANGRALRHFVERERIDCVFAAMEQVWQPAAAAALRRTGVPYLLGLHDGVFHLGESSALKAMTRRLELAFSDGVMTFSQSATRAFLHDVDFPVSRIWTSFLPARAAVAPTMTDADGTAESMPFRFGFFGRMLPYKGLGLLVEAIRVLRETTDRPFQVEIWGSGDDPALADTDLPSEVRVERRWVPEDEVEAVLARFDAVVAPYVDASQSGVIPLAGALGVPALVTPVGGLLEQVQHGRNGLVASAIDVAAFAQTMLTALESPKRTRALGATAAEMAGSERSVRQFGEDLEMALQQLMMLGKRGRR